MTLLKLDKRNFSEMKLNILLANFMSEHKEIGDEEPCYSTKNLIFSFIWAGLAALHKASII